MHLDLRVLVFTAAVALLVGLLFGLAPALRALRTASISSLRQAGAAADRRFQRLFGTGLVVTQLALSVVMVGTGSLFVGYLEHLEHQNLGFRKDHLLLITLDPANSGYRREDLPRLYQELLTRLELIPGVRSATLSGATPISGAAAPLFIDVEGHPERPEDRRYVMANWVGAKYFATYDTPLLAGRDFTPNDLSGRRVAIINLAMARYYVGERNPIGMHFSIVGPRWLLNRSGPNATESYEVVGEVADAKYNDIREAAPRTIYFVAQAPSAFTIRTSINPEAVVPDVRRTVRELLKTVPVTNVRTMAEQVDASIVPERLMATLSGWFGALGALLAAVGLYGLLAYTVARRTNEIGVRMALGATERDITWMVLRDALRLLCAGVAIGVPVAVWGKSLAAHVVEGLPSTFAVPAMAGAAGMIAVALLAAYVPARRATKVDPMIALRHE